MTAIQPVPLPDWAEPYLEALQLHGMEHTAAITARTTPRAVRSLCEKHEEFAYAVEAALEASADKVEAEVRRRAIDGIEKGVYYQGDKVATELQYSDGLLLALAKAKRRREFGDKAEISGPGGTPLTVHIRTFTPPDVAAANQLAEAAAIQAITDVTFRVLSPPMDAAAELV